MKILVITGIYPPEIGGPAQYAKNLVDNFKLRGNTVDIKIFGRFQVVPWGIRHIVFFFYIIPSVIRSEAVITLDAFSAGVVTVASKIFGKRVVFRTGGDAIWEAYVERTGEKILFREFYKIGTQKFSLKEKIMFYLMRWTLQNLSAVIWSTAWQRDVFMEPYRLQNQKHFIIENYYGPKEGMFEIDSNVLVASTRDLKWKNIDVLRKVVGKVSSAHNLELFTQNLEFSEFMKKIKLSRAVALVSLGDISPNMILDAIRLNKPFICTKEVGIYDRIKDAGTFADPLNENEIEKAILELLDKDGYERAKEKVKSFNFTHTWEQIAEEFLSILNSK